MDFFMMHVRKKYVPALLLSWLLLSVFSFGNANPVTDNEPWLDSTLYLDKLGTENYVKGNFEVAENYFEDIMDILERNRDNNSKYIGNIYFKLGVQKKKLWKYNEGISYYEKAINIYQKTNSYPELAMIYMNLGNIYKNDGNFIKAQSYFLKSINILNGLHVPDYITLSRVYNNLGLLYESIGEIEKAINFFTKSIDLKKVHDETSMFFPVGNIALCYALKKEYDKALCYYKQAINFGITYFGEGHINLGNDYINLASLLIKMEREQEALDYYKKALTLYTSDNGKYHPAAYECFLHLGRYYQGKKDFNKALACYQEALIALAVDFSDKDIYTFPGQEDAYSKIDMLDALRHKAQAFYEYYSHTQDIKDLTTSMEGFEKAIALIENVRGGYLNEESKLLLAEHQAKTFSQALNVAFRLYHETGKDRYKEQAFIIAEKSKSAVLMEALRHNEAREFGGVPADLLQQEADLKRSIAFYSEYLYEEKKLKTPDTAKIALWEGKLFALNREYDELISLFNTRYPEYYALKYDNRVVGIRTLQAGLDKDEAVIEYALDDTLLYTFFISSGQFEVFRCVLDSSFYHAVTTLFHHISDHYHANVSAEEFTQFHTAAFSLYTTLIKPLEEYIENKRLVIVPDRQLSFVPFEILLTRPVEDKNILDYRHLPYLLKDHSLGYAFSATHLFDEVKVKNERPYKLLAFVPQYKNSNLQAGLFRSYRQEYIENLSPLPYALEEVEKICELIKTSKVYKGEDATESNFKRNALQYDILHLAMHTVIDNDNPMFSKLVFEPVNDSLNDGFLNTFEIYNLKLHARLVVLSSCSSGNGILRKGEGIISLARGFAYAGCPSIVMTLWEVDDNAGVQIMSGFYTYLKKGKHLSDALRLAKLDYLENTDAPHSHPFLWAGYVGIGQTDPVFIIPVAGVLLYCFSFLIIIWLTGKVIRRYKPKKASFSV